MCQDVRAASPSKVGWCLGEQVCWYVRRPFSGGGKFRTSHPEHGPIIRVLTIRYVKSSAGSCFVGNVVALAVKRCDS